MARVPATGFAMTLICSLGCATCGGIGQMSANNVVVQASHDGPQTSCGEGEFVNSTGVCVPRGWFCGPMYFAGGRDDGCDCDCGAPDPDCAGGASRFYCYNAGRPVEVPSCAACNAPPAPPSDVDLWQEP